MSEELGLERISATVFEGNRPSERYWKRTGSGWKKRKVESVKKVVQRD